MWQGEADPNRFDTTFGGWRSAYDLVTCTHRNSLFFGTWGVGHRNLVNGNEGGSQNLISLFQLNSHQSLERWYFHCQTLSRLRVQRFLQFFDTILGSGKHGSTLGPGCIKPPQHRNVPTGDGGVLD